MQKKEIIKISVSGVLILVLFLTIAGGLSCRRQPKKPSLGQGAAVKPEKAREKGLFSRLEEEAGKVELSRDPFSAEIIKSPKVSQPGPYLSGIVWDQKLPKAIIDDVIVGIGEKVGDNTIIDIQKDKVILNDGSRNFELRLEAKDSF